jgi:hypothetical protein
MMDWDDQRCRRGDGRNVLRGLVQQEFEAAADERGTRMEEQGCRGQDSNRSVDIPHDGQGRAAKQNLGTDPNELTFKGCASYIGLRKAAGFPSLFSLLS